jgi:phospholipid/cholesterol/gamma-HCH transport system substrate-binding protein
MISARTQALRVGTLVGGALVLLMAGLLLVGQGESLWHGRAHYEIHFARTNGLLVGAPVALTGVNVGSVEDIGFPSDLDARYISVFIEVDGRVAARVRENTVASIRTQGILGDKYIELTAGTADSPPRQPNTLIASIDPIDYEAVLGQSGDIVTNIVEVTASLRNVLQAIDRGEGLLGALVKNREAGEMTFANVQHTVAHLEAITGHVEDIVTRIQRGEGMLGTLLHDTETAKEIMSHVASSARSLDRVATRLDRGKGPLPRLIADEELGGRLVDNVDATTRNLADVTTKINRGEGTLGALVNDASLYREAKSFVVTTRKSWAFTLYRGLRWLWPFGGDETTDRPPGDADEVGPQPVRAGPPP